MGQVFCLIIHKAAAMAEDSPFSIHCMICIEQFDHNERYPVVLPCGHTYVCIMCADKLDKCMECRTPLAWTMGRSSPAPIHSQQNQRVPWGAPRSAGRSLASRSPGRDNHGELPQISPSRPILKRLPLPKNVVLLSLMEATKIANEHARNANEQDEYLFLQDSEDEEEKIKVGTSLAVGGCGTYIVVAKEGLKIFPSKPSGSGEMTPSRSRKSSTPTDEDVDTLVRFFHMDHKMDLSPKKDPAGLSPGSKDEPPVQLRRGDRIQIVSVEDGWAKLARGYGYVRVSGGQVAKGMFLLG